MSTIITKYQFQLVFNALNLTLLQIAQHCYKHTQNFHSMFAIISGLEHRTVKRLKETWKLVPPKYIKLKDEMFLIMDPSMNFRRYRNLIQNTNVRNFSFIRIFFFAKLFLYDSFYQNSFFNNVYIFFSLQRFRSIQWCARILPLLIWVTNPRSKV